MPVQIKFGEIKKGGRVRIQETISEPIHCSICLDEIGSLSTSNGKKEVIALEGDVACLAKCYHLFHYRCITPWIVQSENCPNCRSPVRPTYEVLIGAKVKEIYTNYLNGEEEKNRLPPFLPKDLFQPSFEIEGLFQEMEGLPRYPQYIGINRFEHLDLEPTLNMPELRFPPPYYRRANHEEKADSIDCFFTLLMLFILILLVTTTPKRTAPGQPKPTTYEKMLLLAFYVTPIADLCIKKYRSSIL